MPSFGYQPLKFDVRDVPVPAHFAPFAWEYRHGYGMGLEKDGVVNPVSHRANTEERIATDRWYGPREAWFAGYKAGKRVRRGPAQLKTRGASHA